MIKEARNLGYISGYSFILGNKVRIRREYRENTTIFISLNIDSSLLFEHIINEKCTLLNL